MRDTCDTHMLKVIMYDGRPCLALYCGSHFSRLIPALAWFKSFNLTDNAFGWLASLAQTIVSAALGHTVTSHCHRISWALEERARVFIFSQIWSLQVDWAHYMARVSMCSVLCSRIFINILARGWMVARILRTPTTMSCQKQLTRAGTHGLSSVFIDW